MSHKQQAPGQCLVASGFMQAFYRNPWLWAVSENAEDSFKVTKVAWVGNTCDDGGEAPHAAAWTERPPEQHNCLCNFIYLSSLLIEYLTLKWWSLYIEHFNCTGSCSMRKTWNSWSKSRGGHDVDERTAASPVRRQAEGIGSVHPGQASATPPSKLPGSEGGTGKLERDSSSLLW